MGCDWLHVKSWQYLATARPDMYIDIRRRTGDPCIDFVHKVHIHAPPDALLLLFKSWNAVAVAVVVNTSHTRHSLLKLDCYLFIYSLAFLLNCTPLQLR